MLDPFVIEGLINRNGAVLPHLETECWAKWLVGLMQYQLPVLAIKGIEQYMPQNNEILGDHPTAAGSMNGINYAMLHMRKPVHQKVDVSTLLEQM